MGLLQSINRRLKIVEGETFPTTLKIFLAGRKKRRDFEFKKFGFYLSGEQPPKETMQRLTEYDVLRESLDEDWYVETHNLSSGKSCLTHYTELGRKHAFAPNSALAGKDGKALSTWGLEYLVRCGVKIGDVGDHPLSPGDERALDPFKIDNAKDKKIAVVTAIFGDYDRLMPVNGDWEETTDFFVFSDRFFDASKCWQHVHSPYHHVDPRRKARFIKLNLPIFFQEYEWVIWVDGNMLICRSPDSVVSGISDEPFDFATFTHSLRCSTMAEAAACVHLGKENIRELAESLNRIGFSSKSPNTKLFETMAMVLRPSAPSVQKLFGEWWRLLMIGSKRDQLSLPLAIAQTPEVRFASLPETIDRSAEFCRTKHFLGVEKN